MLKKTKNDGRIQNEINVTSKYLHKKKIINPTPSLCNFKKKNNFKKINH